MSRLRTVALAIAVALVAAAAAPAVTATPAEPATGRSGGPTVQQPDDRVGAGRTVTLVTGDRVTVRGDDVSLRPGPGRGEMLFDQYRRTGHLFVVPADALALVNQGRLDRRLFDVTTLLSLGYGDGRRADLPVIVMHRPGAATTLQATDARVTRQLPEIGMTTLRTPKAEAVGFWGDVVRPRAGAGYTLADGVTSIWLDGKRRLLIDRSVPQIEAPAAWAAGYTGTGMTVAVLDTGIDADHPDFAGRIIDTRNFTDAPDANDTVGHGTHVASILAGSGAASDGRYRGVAPDANLMVGKVCPSTFCPDSAILAGMAWASENGADVVNLSLGGPDTPGVDPLEQAVNELTAQTGTLFVVAAGNSGPDGQVSSPASADAALAVGSVDRDESLTGSSSRGPRVGDSAIKPDLTGPGVDIVAARAADGFLGEPVDESYTRMGGTSMASPHAAGAALLLGQQHTDWDAGRLKAALMASAHPNPALTGFEQGSGRVDVAQAIEQSVVTTPASVSLGLQPYPHEDDKVLTRDVTYHNLGPDPTVLDLAVAVTGPDGLPAPPGMFDVQPSTLAVPAGGEATATLTVDTRVPSALGLFSGAVTGRGDGLSARTPIGVDKEPERYALTITHLDRTGEAADNYLAHVLSTDRVAEVSGSDPDGTMSLRLPAGSYHLYSTIHTPTGGRVDVSALAMPLLELDQDTTLVLDGRSTRPMRVRAPERSARSAAAVVMYERRAPNGLGLAAVVAGPDLDHIYTAQVGPAVSQAEVISAVHSQWGEPGDAADFMNSPYTYHLVWFQRGSYWTGFDRQVRRRDLAVVDAAYRAPKPDRLGLVLSGASAPEGSGGAGFFFPFRTPFERTEYYLARDARWRTEYQMLDPGTGGFEGVHIKPTFSLQPGRRVREAWGRAVYGPAFPPVESASQWVYRHAGQLPTVADVEPTQGTDAIAVSVPLYNDFSDDHSGFSLEDTGRTALYVDGQLLGEVPIGGAGEFGVPDAVGDYRLEVEGSRPGFAELSTEVSATWRFRSGHDPSADVTVLPVMAVRFGPSLDEHNSARAGRPFLLPVWVQRQAGASHAPLRSVELDVSYDDGATWRRVPVWGHGSQRVAVLSHPDLAGFVSLRAKATDHAGSSVEQTILRAYRLR